MACKDCLDLCEPIEIRLPAHLTRAIRRAKFAIEEQQIELVTYDDDKWSEPFETVKAEGPWSDILGYEFRCLTCGEHFSLSAETYHGSGGGWQRKSR